MSESWANLAKSWATNATDLPVSSPFPAQTCCTGAAPWLGQPSSTCWQPPMPARKQEHSLCHLLNSTNGTLSTVQLSYQRFSLLATSHACSQRLNGHLGMEKEEEEIVTCFSQTTSLIACAIIWQSKYVYQIQFMS